MQIPQAGAGHTERTRRFSRRKQDTQRGNVDSAGGSKALGEEMQILSGGSKAQGEDMQI